MGGSGTAGRGGTTGTAGRGRHDGHRRSAAAQRALQGAAARPAPRAEAVRPVPRAGGARPVRQASGGSGQGGAGGKSQACRDIEAEYARALPRFLTCSGSQRCGNRASSAPGCVCQIAVQEQAPLELEMLMNVEIPLVRRGLHECRSATCRARRYRPPAPTPARTAAAAANSARQLTDASSGGDTLDWCAPRGTSHK